MTIILKLHHIYLYVMLLSCLFSDTAASGNKEPAKRQRKWNYESLKISEPKNPSISVLTPKQISRPSPGGSDSTHDVDTPKERIGKNMFYLQKCECHLQKV